MTPAVGYTEMRDSGIEWVEKIPKEWKVTRMKTILQNVSEKNHPDATVLSLYRDLGVVPKNSRDDNHNITSEDTSNYKFVRCGDLVINKMKAWQGSLAVSEFEGIVSPAYYVCKFISNSTDKKYLHYLLRCRPYAQEFERLSTGMRVGQWDLGIDDFLRIPVICPSISEQSAIAAYLDSQCAKIDEIIAEAKASIEDYKQWKASIIYEAVTKGLDPKAEMKDSGIEWIGEIPAHWTTIANKYVMRKKKRICEKWKNQNVLSLTMNGVVVRDILNPVGKMPTTFDGYQFAYSGELLMCLFDIDVTPRCVGRVFCDGVTSPAYSCFQLNNHADLGYYYYYYLMVDNTKELLHLAKNLRHSFTEEQLGMLKVPFPPFKEQSTIAAYLDTQCAKIDELSAEKLSLIADLEAYKKSLIYEVVTGKRRVC
jgi:type I restriction enzyme S subunit